MVMTAAWSWVKEHPAISFSIAAVLLPGLLLSTAVWSFVFIFAAPVLVPVTVALAGFLVRIDGATTLVVGLLYAEELVLLTHGNGML